MSIKSVGQLIGMLRGKVWKDLMLLYPVKIHVWQTKQHKHWVVNKVITLLSLGPLQSSLQSYNLCGSTWNKYKSLSLFHHHPLTTGTYDQTEWRIVFKNIVATSTQPPNLPTNTNYGGWTTVKKSDVLLKMHTTYTYTQEEKKLKKYKNKLHKRFSPSLLANFLGRFLQDFFSVCAASLSPSKVCHSFSTNLFLCRSLFVHFKVSATGPHLGVKSAQWWHYQETGVQYNDCTDLVLDEANFVLSKKRKEKKNDVLFSLRTSALFVSIPIFPLI